MAACVHSRQSDMDIDDREVQGREGREGKMILGVYVGSLMSLAASYSNFHMRHSH